MQVYGGDLFEQADQVRDFVLAKINRAIGTRAAGITAPPTYELTSDAIGEAVVNAIAHRDYQSNASVEIRLSADRLEIWNPCSFLKDVREERQRVTLMNYSLKALSNDWVQSGALIMFLQVIVPQSCQMCQKM